MFKIHVLYSERVSTEYAGFFQLIEINIWLKRKSTYYLFKFIKLVPSLRPDYMVSFSPG